MKKDVINDDIAIIGFGAAGYSAAKTMRNSGYEGNVHVFINKLLYDTGNTDAIIGPVNPMLTTYFVADKISVNQMFPFGSMDEIVRELRIILHDSAPVSRLFARQRRIQTSDGNNFGPFRSILVATGAKPFIPPLPSCATDNHVYTMRTINDAYRLRSQLKSGKTRSAIVVGASMVGIKLAELLVNSGVDTILIDSAKQIFPLAALPDIASLIEERVRKNKIKLVFEHSLKDVIPIQHGCMAKFQKCNKSGQENSEYQKDAEVEILDYCADIICLCIGTRPMLDFIDKTELDSKRGLVVDEYMETTLPGIYAAGDCAAGMNIQLQQASVIGLWQNAISQGRTAGNNMIGTSRIFEGNIFQNNSHFLGMDFVSFGNVCESGEVIADGKDGFNFRAVIGKNNEIACVNILDNSAVSGPIRHYMIKRFLGYKGMIPAQQAGLLIKCGLSPDTISRLEGLK